MTNGTHSHLHIEGCPPVTVYRLAPVPLGVNARIWNAGNGDTAPHGDAVDVWTGGTDPATGFPSHPNPPTAEVVEADWNISTNNVGGTTYPSDGTDQFEAWGWIDTTGVGDVLLRDNNGNTGERGEVWIGLCGGNPVRQPGYREGSDTAGGGNQYLLSPVLLPEGIHFVYTRMSDLSAYAGIDLEYTTDLTGAAGWVNVPAARSFSERPVVECQQVTECDLPVLGWDTCPPPECAPVAAPVAPPVDPPAPATSVPVPDNEVDTAIRSGLVGTSTAYALADHNHPIRRQALVTPTLVYGGTGTDIGTNLGVVVLDRWSDEETVGIEWRAYSEQRAGIGWGWWTVPALTGFQQPKITVGTYRSQSTTPQTDDGDGNAGAAPQGPFMGAEAAHWSSTRRVYLGYYRRDNTIQTYTMIRAEWTRL